MNTDNVPTRRAVLQELAILACPAQAKNNLSLIFFAACFTTLSAFTI
jgi:hypothetical protein